MPAPTNPPISACELEEWDAQPVGDDLPDDRARQRAEDYAGIDDVRLDNATADRFGDVQSEYHEGDEIEESGPGDGVMRTQHTRRNNGRDRVGGIVHAVEEVERQRDDD